MAKNNLSVTADRELAAGKNLNRRSGVAVLTIVIGLVLAIAMGGFAWFMIGGGSVDDGFDPLTAQVQFGEFAINVLDQGEVQSSENVEIRCEARARNGLLNVLRVVPEGTLVEEGDFLVQLDETGFQKELEQQKLAMANAETTLIQAETSVKTAEIALVEYEEGTLREGIQVIKNEIYDAEAMIAQAEQELRQAEATLTHSTVMAARGYVTQQNLQATEFAVDNARIKLRKGQNSKELAETKLKVLNGISADKIRLELESQIKTAEVAFLSQKEAYEVEKEKLLEIETNIKNCTIVVPPGVSGQVVYATESSRSGVDWILEEGGTARENQVLVRLPNPQKMEVKASINEQSITQIAVRMPAVIRVDALNNQRLRGVVTKVSQYAEQGSSWMASAVRKYPVNISIIDPPEALKPGMNASVTIQTRYEATGLLAPLQTIFGLQDRKFCLVKRGESAWETREITISGQNNQYVLIESGLEEGDILVMNPGAHKERMDLPEIINDSRIKVSDEEVSQIKNSLRRPGQLANAFDNDLSDENGSKQAAPSPSPNATALITERDNDGDGKLSRSEAGEPFVNFFEQIDSNKDGFLDQSELQASITRMKQRQQQANGNGTGKGNGKGSENGSGTTLDSHDGSSARGASSH